MLICFEIHVFKAYKEFGKQIQLENSEKLVAEPVFYNQDILVLFFFFFFFNGFTKARVTLKIC